MRVVLHSHCLLTLTRIESSSQEGTCLFNLLHGGETFGSCVLVELTEGTACWVLPHPRWLMELLQGFFELSCDRFKFDLDDDFLRSYLCSGITFTKLLDIVTEFDGAFTPSSFIINSIQYGLIKKEILELFPEILPSCMLKHLVWILTFANTALRQLKDGIMDLLV